MSQPIISTRYNRGRAPVGVRFAQPSRVKQEFAQESDINYMIGRFLKTGHIPVRGGTPFYGDFSSGASYQEAVSVIMRVEDEFMELPSEIRAKFSNDPSRMIEFIHTQPDEARALGLLPPLPAAPAAPEPVKPPATQSQKDETPPPAQ